MKDNKEMFDRLLKYVKLFSNSRYVLYDEVGNKVDAVYEAVYETDNGSVEDGYEVYQCIVFKTISDGMLFEMNYHNMPTRVLCDKEEVYVISDD